MKSINGPIVQCWTGGGASLKRHTDLVVEHHSKDIQIWSQPLRTKQTVRSSCGFALSHFGVQESCTRTWGNILGGKRCFFLLEKLSSRPFHETGETSNHDQIFRTKIYGSPKGFGKMEIQGLSWWAWRVEVFTATARVVAWRKMRNPANISTFYIGKIKIASLRNGCLGWCSFADEQGYSKGLSELQAKSP